MLTALGILLRESSRLSGMSLLLGIPEEVRVDTTLVKKNFTPGPKLCITLPLPYW